MPQALIALFTNLAGIIGGALNGVLGTAVSMMKAGTRAAFQFHQEGISLARDLGMGLNQANAYTRILTERTQELAAKYGVTADAIKAVQRNISETTGKQLLLNDAQAEGFVQANKLVGEQTTNRFMDTIMNGMGGQVHAVQGAISKAYATAAKQGLNAQKFSKTVADNLSMANRLNFRNGINGITRMAAMAEKFGLSMKSVETAAGQFMELDSAIEHSAHLQMLGGSIGAAFGNPLENAYESMYDPEAFAKRMEDAMKGMATFDPKKGYATMSAMNQDILRNYAKEMGLNAEEVVANAKKMAEVRYKETAFAGEINKYAGNGEDREARRNFIVNNSQVTPDGRLQVNGKDINSITEEEWKNMMAFDGKSDTDILKDQAISLISINEALTGNAEKTAAAFAKGLALDKNAQDIIKGINNIGNVASDIAENLGKGAGAALMKILDWIKEHGSTLKNIANGVVKVSSFLADNWKGLLAAILGWKFLLKPLLGLKLGGGTTVGGRLGAKALGGIKKGFGGFKKMATSRGFWDVALGKQHKNAAGRWVNSKGRFISNKLATVGKVAKFGGAALGAGIGTFNAISAQEDYATRRKELNEQLKSGAISKVEHDNQVNEARIQKNEDVGGGIGTAVGSILGMFFGPIGSAIGGFIGGWVGKLIGKYWGPIINTIGGFFSKIGSAISRVWKQYITPAWDAFMGGIKWFGDTLINIWSNTPIGTLTNAIISFIESPTEFINSAKATINKAVDGVKGGIEWIINGVSSIINGIKNSAIGKAIGKVVDGVTSVFSAIMHPIETIQNAYKKVSKWVQEHVSFSAIKEGIKSILPDWIVKIINETLGGGDEKAEKHASGGIVGGNSYSGDRILTGLNSGEMVLNQNQQSRLFNFINNASDVISTALNGDNGIKTRPFGENSFRMIPRDISVENGQKVSEITVKDVNLNVNGTIKLDAGNFAKNIDINQLLNDSAFVSSLKEIIKNSINNDMNGGRFMNDNATLRGSIGTTTYWGR